MAFSDEISLAAADIGDQLHEGTDVTVTNPPTKTAGSLNTTTMTRSASADAATFPARRNRRDDTRSGGEAGSRGKMALYTAEAAAVEAGRATGSTLTAATIRAGGTLVDGSETYDVVSTTLRGGLVDINCQRR